MNGAQSTWNPEADRELQEWLKQAALVSFNRSGVIGNKRAAEILDPEDSKIILRLICGNFAEI